MNGFSLAPYMSFVFIGISIVVAPTGSLSLSLNLIFIWMEMAKLSPPLTISWPPPPPPSLLLFYTHNYIIYGWFNSNFGCYLAEICRFAMNVVHPLGLDMNLNWKISRSASFASFLSIRRIGNLTLRMAWAILRGTYLRCNGMRRKIEKAYASDCRRRRHFDK